MKEIYQSINAIKGSNSDVKKALLLIAKQIEKKPAPKKEAKKTEE